MRKPLFVLTILLLVSLACRFSASPMVEPVETAVEPVETPPPSLPDTDTTSSTSPAEFAPQVTQVGDPNVSYANVEFTADNQYMTPLQKRVDEFYPNTLLKMGKP